MNPFWLLMSYECPLTTKFLYCGDTQIKNTKILYYRHVLQYNVNWIKYEQIRK